MEQSENTNLSKPESPDINSREKYSQLIREFLVSHSNTPFEENNSLENMVESETRAYETRYFIKYDDSYVSRLLDDSTSIQERNFPDKERSGFFIQAPFYIYKLEKSAESFTRLFLYKRASVVIIQDKENKLQILVSGEEDGGTSLIVEKKYLYQCIQQITESAVGEGIFFAGLKHVALKVVASYTEDQIITSDPSQLLEIKKARQQLDDINKSPQ
jgi:hypothetical protein